jgi:alkanesulfonate monooxygenase SsuD/methylene tetrahydromethanopterin reductase-like flavin-dependent oxidoreductase (luciferase family)
VTASVARPGAFLAGDPVTSGGEAALLEAKGFGHVWFGEVPSVGLGDPFLAMGHAGAGSERLELATAVTSAGLRSLLTLVTSLGSLNRVAPGRIALSYGTGTLSRRVVGLPPLGLRDFEVELVQLRSLLDGAQVDFGEQRARQHVTRRRAIDLDPPIKLFVAAGGPRTARLAGRYGDGMILTGEVNPTRVRQLIRAAMDGAAEVGRGTVDFRVNVELGPLIVVRPREAVDSLRVRALVQPTLSCYLGYWAVLGIAPASLEGATRLAYEQFLRWTERQFGVESTAQIMASRARTI